MFNSTIKATTAAQLRALRKHGIDVKDHSARQDEKDLLFKVDAIISSEDKQRLESEGYIVEIISDLSDVARARLKEVSKTNRFSEVNTMSDLESLTIAGGYMNVEEIETELIKLNKINPDLVELIELPNKTWENRTSRAVRLHTGIGSDRPGVMFIGGVHAREWGTSDICMHFISKLVNSYKSNKEVTYGNKTFTSDQVKTILENINLIVFPDVNPDGRAFSQAVNNPDDPNTNETESVWWRKNRNPNPVPNPHPLDPEIHRSAGVDLNRNFDFLWNSGIGTEEDGMSISVIYKGKEPFSEPESKNVKWLFDTYKNIKCFVDIHCHVGKILLSWGEDDTQCFYPEQNYRNLKYDEKRGILCGDNEPDIYREYMHPSDLQILANYATRMSDALTAVRRRKYIVEPSVGLYPTSGTSQDYAFSQRVVGDENRSRIFAYTIEFGAPAADREHPESTFIPEYEPVMRNIMDDIGSALTELCFAVASENNSQ
jgi:carboxypeptidase T